MLGVSGLYTVPQQIQGFDTDDAFDSEFIDTAELKMGIDGTLSAGFVFVPVVQSITLQADSPSVYFFEAWYAAEHAAAEKLSAFGIIFYPSISRKYAMTTGYMNGYVPFSGAKKILQPRKFTITWESAVGAPI
jgi:hypothetical protein